MTPDRAPRRPRGDRSTFQGQNGAATVSVVVPVKNEAENIGWVLDRLPDLVDEVILVDGQSTDDTVAVARAHRPDIRVVSEDIPGKGAALRAGFRVSRGDYIVMIDADGSMDPAEIAGCVQALQDRRSGRAGGVHLVKGSRFMTGGGTSDMGHLRRLGNAGLLRFSNRLYGARFTDLCYGLFAFRRDQLEALDLQADGFEIETEIVVKALRAGIVMGEIPSFEAPRRNGESNLNTWRDGWRVLTTLVVERRRPASVPLDRP
jgi:glycosyltransferase involved in cell wall biosynthesis